MAKLIEEINKVINKIDENLSKSLNSDEIQPTLAEIDDNLIKVKNSAEREQKELVNEKVENLRKIMEANLSSSEELKWWKVKIFLNKDIKNGLSELKDEIIELEKSQEVLIKEELNESKGNIIISGKEMEELEEWRNAFPGQNAKFVLELINKLKEDLVKKNSQNLSIVDKARGGKDRPSFTAQISERATDAAEKQVKISKELIETADGFTPALTPFAGAANFVGAYTHAGAIAVAGAAELVGTAGALIAEDVIDKVDKARSDFGKHIEAHAQNATKLTGKVLDNTADVTKDFFDIFKGSGTWEAKLESAKELIDRAEKEIGGLRKQIDELKAENKEALEGQAKRYEKQIDELKEFYNEALEKKDVENKELQKQVTELSNKGQDNLMAVIGQLTKGPNSSSGGQ